MIGDQNPPQNPVLVVHRRGGDFEVCHRGAFAVLRGDRVVRSAGEHERSYFARSATKPFQALPLLVHGGLERFALTPAEIAVATSSHGGEPMHIDAVASLLEKGGRHASDLQCGSHAPLHEPSAHALVRRNETAERAAQQLLGQARLDAAPVRADAGAVCDLPRPRACRAARDPCDILDVTGASRRRCGWRWTVTTFELPLVAMARGFRNLANPERACRPDAAAARALVAAVAAEPLMIAGHDRSAWR
ncbi:MAG: asparaginase [Planctomycetota bacterium]